MLLLPHCLLISTQQGSRPGKARVLACSKMPEDLSRKNDVVECICRAVRGHIARRKLDVRTLFYGSSGALLMK